MQVTIETLLIICPMAFLAGFVDSIAGGGGLISLPAYIAVGLPPHYATATNKCSSTFAAIFSMARFMKEKEINYKCAITSAVAALIGSPIGALINLAVPEIYLVYILVIIVPLVTIFVMLKKDFGDVDTSNLLSKAKFYSFSILIGFTIGMYDGFFGPGTGTFLIFAYTTLMGFGLMKALGNTKVVNLSSNIAAFVTFAFSGNIVWLVGLPAAVFGIAGSWLGSGLALKNGKKLVKPVFFFVLAILMGKIIYDNFL